MPPYIDADTTADEAAHITRNALRRDLDDQDGAVDLDACPTRDGYRRCHCGICVVCGESMHTAIHGPCDGQPPGSKPYGHRFRPRDE